MIYEFKRFDKNADGLWTDRMVPPHGYFTPFSSIGACLEKKVGDSLYASDRAFVLENWKFASSDATATSVDDEILPFTESPLPYTLSGEGTLLAATEFDVFDPSRVYVLSVDGVGGALEAYVNGSYVGASLIGFGEFNLSGAVVKGKNTLLLRIAKNDLASKYDARASRPLALEGNVVLSYKADAYLTDFYFTPKTDGMMKEGVLELSVGGAVEKISVVFAYNDEILSEEDFVPTDGIVKATFKGAFETYSAETPVLYDVFVRVFAGGDECECTHVYVAFNETEIKGQTIARGGVPVKFFAIRSNDSTERAAQSVKALNANAMVVGETADAAFYARCAEKGLYLIPVFPFEGIERDNGKKSKKNKHDTEIADEYFATITDYLYSRVKSEPAVSGFAFGKLPRGEFATNGVKEFALSCGRPVLGQTVVCEGDGPRFAVLSAREARIDRLQTLVDDPSIAVVIVDGYADLVKEDGASSEEAVFVKYAFRPFRSELSDNRTVRVKSNYAFRTVDDVRITVSLVKGLTETVAATWTPMIKAGETRDFSAYFGEYDDTCRVKVRFEENGRHIATETLRILSETVRPEDIEDLKVKSYTYTVRYATPTLAKTEENTLVRRAWFVPCSSERVCDLGKIYDADAFGDRTYTLSGEWDFCYYEKGLPRTFGWSGEKARTLTLPCSWESAGVEKFAYAEGYPFKANAKTFVVGETENYVHSYGIYRKIVNVGDTAFTYILSFKRFSGSLELHINGKYVGYSILGRAEFDVTDYLAAGENEIVVIVGKNTPTAYLNGEGFLATGILGDVVLIKSARGGLKDYAVGIKRMGADYAADIRLRFFDGSADKCIVIVKKKGKVLLKKTFPVADGEAQVNLIGDFELYNAEKPVYYDVYVKAVENDFVSECVRFPLAFTLTSIIGDTVYLNEAPLKLKGVVYNAKYNALGQLTTLTDVKKDLALIKEYGFNAVRPTVPVCDEFYAVALTMGLYVTEDVGIDTRAIAEKNAKKRDAVMNERAFESVAYKRALDAYVRTKNYANVVSYFLAENGNTLCGGKVVATLKELSSRPVFCFGENAGDGLCASFPAVNDVVDMINEAMNKRPVFLSEYASGSGVGCATINEYEELFRTSCSVGGFVGYFVDDIIGNVGKKADGIFTSERIPYPSADALRYVYRPLRSELTDGNAVLEITNTASFVTADHVYVVLNVISNGITLSKTHLNISVPPKTTKRYDVFVGHVEGDMFLNVEYYEKRSDRFLYAEQHRIHAEMQSFSVKDGKAPLEVTEIFDYVEVGFDCGFVRFNKRLGAITEYVLMGKSLLKTDSVIDGGNAFGSNIFRPFTRNIKKNAPHFDAVCKSFTLRYVPGAKDLTVETESFLIERGKELYIVQDEYDVHANGVIEVRSTLTPLKKNLPLLDCFGKQIRFNNAFGNVDYYGNGPTDNYIDMCEHTTVGIYNLNVDKTFETLPVLQECGNRTNVRYAIVRDNEGSGVVFAAKNVPYQLRVSPYTDDEIIRGRLSGERPKQSGVYVDVNAFVCGVGTSENGYPMPQYVVRSGEHFLRFDIIPVNALQ